MSFADGEGEFSLFGVMPGESEAVARHPVAKVSATGWIGGSTGNTVFGF